MKPSLLSLVLWHMLLCFTEWSLGESLTHAAEYVRIGPSFPKSWVIERGSYFARGPRTQAWILARK